jgi:hypothetical protein
MAKQYSDAEKAAYWKEKALARPRPIKGPAYYRAKPYQVKENKKNYKKKRGFLSNFGTTFGSTVGGAMGGPVGSAIGAVAGKGADMLMEWVSGQGDYVIKGNSLITKKDAVPSFSGKGSRCTVINHREYICDIYSGPDPANAGSTEFDIKSFRINPGLPGTFPWLNNLARNYEQYVVQGMIFEYKTNSAVAVGSTNTALGTVILATQYNSLSQPFISKQQMENYEFAQSTIPSNSVMHPIECDPKQTQCGGIFNTVQLGAEPGDRRLYDIGEFSVATQGMQEANVNLGELWVTYKICLLKPKLQVGGPEWDHFDFDVPSSAGGPLQAFGNLTLAQQASTNTGISRLFYDSTTNIGNIQIRSGFVGYICIASTVYGGASTSRAPTWGVPTTPVANNINVVGMFDNRSKALVSSNYNAAGTQLGGQGGQTYQVFHCRGGNSMFIECVNRNVSTTGVTQEFTGCSLDVFSIGYGVLSGNIPYVAPVNFKLPSFKKQLKKLVLDRVQDTEPTRDVEPDPIYEDWQVVKDRQINLAMGTPQRVQSSTPNRPY